MGDSILPGVGAAVGAATDIFNTGAQIVQNRQNWKHTQKMYQWQRADALADWNMQNAYNSPAQQMQRLKNAGLNPNLVYGHGADAGEAAPVRSSSPSSYHQEAPQSNLGGALAQFVDLTRTMVQTDNMRTQKELMEADIAYKNAGIRQMDTRSMLNEITSERISSKTPLDLELLRSRIGGQNISNDVAIQENVRRWAYEQMAQKRTDVSVKEAISKIALNWAHTNMLIPAQVQELGARVAQLNASAKVENAEADLRSKGLSYHDALWQRTVGGFVKDVFDAMSPSNLFYHPPKSSKYTDTSKYFPLGIRTPDY